MKNQDVLDKIYKLKKSNVKNYLETKERLFLSTIFEKIENYQESDTTINGAEEIELEKIYNKYKRFF